MEVDMAVIYGYRYQRSDGQLSCVAKKVATYFWEALWDWFRRYRKVKENENIMKLICLLYNMKLKKSNL